MTKIDWSKIRTNEDVKELVVQLKEDNERLKREANKLEERLAAQRLEDVERRIETLAHTGMDYQDAFEKAVAELEEEEARDRARAEQRQSRHIQARLDEMSEAEEMLILLQQLDSEDEED
jgi:hypothetical protein